MTGQESPAPCGTWHGTCPQCGKHGATAEHIMWCDWER